MFNFPAEYAPRSYSARQLNSARKLNVPQKSNEADLENPEMLAAMLSSADAKTDEVATTTTTTTTSGASGRWRGTLGVLLFTMGALVFVGM